MTDALKQIWAEVDQRTGPQRMETEAEHIARDMREGRFPARSDRIQVPVKPPVDATPKTYTEAEALAVVAAAYRQAAEALEDMPRRLEPLGGQRTSYVQLSEGVAAILALTEAPARAALDALLQDLIAKSAAAVRAMTPDQRNAMLKAQARSMVRANASFGSDTDEAAYREAHRLGDIKTMKRLDLEAAARVLAVERAMGVA